MTRPYGLLRAGFPFVKTLGMRRVTNEPMDVAVGEDGTVFVLGRSGDIIKLPWEDAGHDWDQYQIAPIGSKGAGDGQFTWPVQLLIDSQQNLWVSDEKLHRITILASDGEFISKWGEHGHDDGQLDRPSGIAFDNDEKLYVADTMNHRVQMFTRDGKFLTSWGKFGSGEGEFNMPWGVAVDELNEVYVADWRNDRVQKFTGEGEFLFEFGTSGDSDGEFNRPAGLDIDSDGDIYVADMNNNRVQLFDQDGRYVDQFIGDATLSNMARVYMITNGRPLRLREMADLGPQKRLRSPRSVRVEDDGRMFIPDFASYRVQVYQKEAIPLTEEQIPPPLRSPSLQTT